MTNTILILGGIVIIEALLIYILFKSRSNYKEDFSNLELEFEKEMALSDAKIVQLTERLDNYNTYISDKAKVDKETASTIKEINDEDKTDEEKDFIASNILSSL
jgi:FtsZ-interacting cell division protein ZipA